MSNFMWCVGLVGACIVGGVMASHMALGTVLSLIFGLGIGALYAALSESKK